jgi:hypothetical protein
MPRLRRLIAVERVGAFAEGRTGSAPTSDRDRAVGHTARVIHHTSRPVRIGNCSGFFGDRLSAAAELVDSGEIDVLTGDWLAELTMLILARQRMKNGPGSGYARTFLIQMEQVLGRCLERGIKVVTNAGGLDPAGCAAGLRALADRLGLNPRIGVVAGDDVLELVRANPDLFGNLDTGEALAGQLPMTANAYVGGGPVAAALTAGADVVITGRVTDAALVVGPAAWWHGWSFDDAARGEQQALDRLAGAVVAGHVIECGTQATGGNYSFFRDVTVWPAGFPIAEVAADGSSVITKPTGSGGLVSTGTVTAQLVYEIAGPAYANPDVTARFETIRLSPAGPDRVAISGVQGAPPPERLKVAVNLFAGYRNSMALVLTGSDARDKAELALRMITGLGLADSLGEADKPAPTARELAAASTLPVQELVVAFEDVAAPDPATTAAAQGHLRLTVKDPDQKKVGKPFTTAVVESALGSYPGMFPTDPPGEGSPFGVYWPTLVDRTAVRVSVRVDDEPVAWSDPQLAHERGSARPTDAGAPDGAQEQLAWSPPPGTRLGAIVGARSGDKGGNANVGLWVPAPGEGTSAELDEAAVDARYAWLRTYLTENRVHDLLPEAAGLTVDVHPLPNLRAVNVVIHGLLGRGVADSTSLDPQAKGLGEHLRARVMI